MSEFGNNEVRRDAVAVDAAPAAAESVAAQLER
jgi:hypothetical protein